MTKYIIRRLIHGAISIVIVVALVMILIYALMDRNLIFASDALYTKQNNNQKTTYKCQRWEEYGYIDYVTYSDWLTELVNTGEIDADKRTSLVSIGKTADADSDEVAEYVKAFTDTYKSKGYSVKRLDAVMLSKKKVADGGNQALFAYKDIPLYHRLITYFTKLIQVDNIHNVKEDIGERKLTFTLHDPAYGGEKFSPAIMGNGTTHKYLLYFDSKFPYIHQNIVTINLGVSYSVNTGVDVFNTMSKTQGAYLKSNVIYPTGAQELSADDVHTATYSAGSLNGLAINAGRYTDDYTNVLTVKNGRSRVGYSFVFGILSIILSYAIGLPIGLLMARHKDGLIDKIGTVYIVFIISVPSLAYIFLVKAIGGSLFHLPTTFNVEATTKLMFILPIISLSLRSIGNTMRWLRRFMIDQMNADYVKFARSGGLTENEIFTKHILKNASIPIIHGIPADILFALVGALITERVYAVPGAGGLLVEAIQKYDNAVIVGVTLFYAVLTVLSYILGDVLMAMVDPRISFSDEKR
ncbi:MAG: ABC transporter permease [Lachnospiraceae bacterium]|nr:ABC transporter permease [Lachnospiraceae bacterium]